MAWDRKYLKLSKEVAASETEYIEEVVPAGKRIHVIHFHGHAAYSVNSVVKAVWDHGGAGEENIWSTKGDTESDIDFEALGDGVKKLAILLENGEDGPLVLTGSIEYAEEL